jgi:hypothetical protein
MFPRAFSILNYPTLPSSEMAISFCASTANSIGIPSASSSGLSRGSTSHSILIASHSRWTADPRDKPEDDGAAPEDDDRSARVSADFSVVIAPHSRIRMWSIDIFNPINALIQIQPGRVQAFNQIHLPFATIALQRLLTLNRENDIRVSFEPNQVLRLVFRGKTSVHIITVFPHSPLQITGYTNVDHSTRLVGHYVDKAGHFPSDHRYKVPSSSGLSRGSTGPSILIAPHFRWTADPRDKPEDDGIKCVKSELITPRSLPARCQSASAPRRRTPSAAAG